MKLQPQTKLGKWSVWLNIVFLMVIAVSVFLVKVLGVLSFDDRWWDVTVLIFIASIVAFILGIISIRKNNESATSVYVSVVIGLFSIIFIFLHGLFISD